MDRLTRLAALGILVSLGVLGCKLLAARRTHSAALYADALESMVNVATAIMALFAVRLSAEPPDSNHPFGHAKVELFAAMAEGGLIVLAALLILQQAWSGFLHPVRLVQPLFGLALNGAGSLGNGLWAICLLRTGTRRHSPALTADGRHLLADLVTSAGVMLGVALAAVTAIPWLDPLVAGLVAVYVLATGFQLARQSAAGLMDEAPPQAFVHQIETLLAEHGAGALEAHDIRMRMAGRHVFLQFHLVVPGAMSVASAHQICDRLEQAVRADQPHIITTIHVEPEEKAKRHGAVRL